MQGDYPEAEALHDAWAEALDQGVRFGQEVERELDRGDGVVLVRSRGPVPAELVLGPVVSDPRYPPGAPGGGLVLAEVQLPHLVRPGRV